MERFKAGGRGGTFGLKRVEGEAIQSNVELTGCL